MITKNCPVCKNDFNTYKYKHQTFCSYECSKNGKVKRGIEKLCEKCGSQFYCFPYRKNARFCSSKCQINWQKSKLITTNCKSCGLQFTRSSGTINPNRLAKNNSRNGAIYCSVKCAWDDTEYRNAILSVRSEQYKNKVNKLEQKAYDLFSALPYKFEKQVLLCKKFCVDTYFPNEKLIVQIDGDYWHGNPIRFPILTDTQLAQQTKDKSVNAYLSTAGFKVLRLWEAEIKNDPQQCLKKISDAISENSSLQ